MSERISFALHGMVFGFTLSSTIVRVDHPEIGNIQYPLICCVASGIGLFVQIAYMALRKR